VAEDPASLLEYLVDRMLTGYEQDDDVTVLVLHVPVRDGTAKALVTESLGVQAAGGSPPRPSRAQTGTTAASMIAAKPGKA
jgi:lysophospholipid acyltransferase (LPLAT)-like uncharacterized protein